MAASETIAQILDAAGEVFAEKGFRQATVREICSRAGVNLAAVNYHFGDKERLYIEAVKSARSALEATAPLPDEMELAEPEDALRIFITTLAKRLLSEGGASWRHRLLVREFTNPSRACEEMMSESIVPTMDRLRLIIQRMLPQDVPDHILRKLSISIISQCAYYRLQDRIVAMMTPEPELRDHFSADDLAEHISRFSIAAIRSYLSVDSPCKVQESR